MVAKTKPSILVETALDLYYREHIERKAVAKKAADIFMRYINAFMGKRAVADIRECDLEEYMAARRAGKVVIHPKRPKPRPPSDSTLRREIGVLSAALRYCHKRRYRSGERIIPADDMPEIPMPDKPEPRSLWMTLDQETHLLSFVDPPPDDRRLSRIYRFLMVALETAGRRAAIETLRWDQIDMERRTINLNPAGRRQTKKRRAIVPISDRLMRVIERARLERTQDVWFLDDPGDISYEWKKLTKGTGLEWVTPHVLRHTWATRAARAGVPMIQVAGMLGDTIATVEKNYYHHSPDYMKAAASWRDRERA